MKKLLALSGLLLMSLSARADFCRTEMVDYMGYVRLIITQAQPNYLDPYCASGYQQCLASIHLNPALRPSCRVMRVVQENPRPNPTPRPSPAPRPRPRPQWNPEDETPSRPTGTQPPRAGSSSGRVQPPVAPRAERPRLEVDMLTMHDRTVLTADGEETVVEVFDGQRKLEVGETVYMAGATYTVVAVNGGDYDLQVTGSRRKEVVRVNRAKIAIARGCSLNVCVTDPVFNVARGRMEAVAGITTLGELVTKNDGDGKLNPSPVSLKEIALAKGCVMDRASQDICVGNTVQSKNGRYYEVLAIQHDRNLVVRISEGRNTAVYPNIAPADLTVVR